MVRRQIAGRGLTDPAVLAAMRQVPRHEFVLPEYLDLAYSDQPLPIGFDQTISQPYIVAYMTQALAPGPDDLVLEIGTGSGYQTAVLAELAREVRSVEIVPGLARRAARVLNELGYGLVRLAVADGHAGWPGPERFDGILLTAAPARVPPALLAQLAEGGRLVAPVGTGAGQRVHRYTRRGTELDVEDLDPVRFVPMTGRPDPGRPGPDRPPLDPGLPDR